MKNIVTKLKNEPLVIYVIFNLLYVLIGSYMFFNNYLGYCNFSYGYIILLCVNIIFILILFFKKKYIKNNIDVFLLLIIILAIISTIFAYKPKVALFGKWGRYEGLFVICYYTTILFLTSFIKKESRKYVIYSILIFGLIQCLYAICQKFNIFGVHTRIKNGWRWVTGFTGNRNFFATLMVLCICYSIGLFFMTKDKFITVLHLFLIYIFSICLLLSKSLGCLTGLIAVLIVLLIYSIKNKHVKKFIIIFAILIFNTIFLESIIHLTGYINDINETKSELVETINRNTNSNVRYAAGRIELWRETIKVVPKYLLHGVGIDNFANIINGRPIRSQKGYFDKAHNEYLQILVTMGIFSLISYLCMHFLVIKNGIKNKEIYLLLPVIGYLIQAQFNISVIEVAPIFYIALGLCINRCENREN